MNIILTAGILLIILSIVFRKSETISPYWGFLIVFLIMGFQEGVEGDFMIYKQEWQIFSTNSNAEIRTAETDMLWQAIYHYLAPVMPFWLFLILMSGFECWVLWIVCENYGSREYGWIGPILFFFTFYMMLIEMKALRQGLAAEMCMFAYFLTDKKKRGWLWSIIIAVSATFIHTSAVVAVPFVVLQIIMVKRERERMDIEKIGRHTLTLPLILVAVYLVVYYLKATSLGGWLTSMALIFDSNSLASYLEGEQKYLGNEVSPLIIMYDAVMVFLCTWFMQRTSRRYQILSIAAIIGCFLDMLLFGVGALPRIATYYLIYDVLVYPKLTEMVSNKYGKPVALVLTVFLIGYAIKTSLPMIVGTDGPFAFASYHFVFSN